MPKQEPTNRVQEQARKQVRDLNGFDYNVPAELFSTPSKTHTGNLRYKRFDTAAEALRFAVEEIPAPALMGAFLEVDEARFGAQEIRYLYENAAYPLTRPTMLSGVRGGVTAWRVGASRLRQPDRRKRTSDRSPASLFHRSITALMLERTRRNGAPWSLSSGGGVRQKAGASVRFDGARPSEDDPGYTEPFA
jgi:hypothetical protein